MLLKENIWVQHYFGFAFQNKMLFSNPKRFFELFEKDVSTEKVLYNVFVCWCRMEKKKTLQNRKLIYSANFTYLFKVKQTNVVDCFYLVFVTIFYCDFTTFYNILISFVKLIFCSFQASPVSPFSRVRSLTSKFPGRVHPWASPSSEEQIHLS